MFLSLCFHFCDCICICTLSQGRIQKPGEDPSLPFCAHFRGASFDNLQPLSVLLGWRCFLYLSKLLHDFAWLHGFGFLFLALCKLLISTFFCPAWLAMFLVCFLLLYLSKLLRGFAWWHVFVKIVFLGLCKLQPLTFVLFLLGWQCPAEVAIF